MKELATALENLGHSTFLPQRDGLELTHCVEKLVELNFSMDRANRLMSEAIFALDIYQVLEGCDIVLANLNGRVPDEGTVAEVAMAWSRGKTVIGYKSDSRTVFCGQDNPLVAGLFDFCLYRTIDEAAQATTDALSRTVPKEFLRENREQEILSRCQLGSQIWKAISDGNGVESVIEVIVDRGTAAKAV